MTCCRDNIGRLAAAVEGVFPDSGTEGKASSANDAQGVQRSESKSFQEFSSVASEALDPSSVVSESVTEDPKSVV